MKKANEILQKWIPQKDHIKLVIATFLVTLGVYFSFPERGLSATLPMMLLFSFGAFLIYPKVWFCAPSGAGIALFYGVMAALSDPFFFCFMTFLASLCASFSALFLKKFLGEKKVGRLVLCLLLAAVGVVIPLLFAGTPFRFLQEKKEVLAYLEEKYPDQTFTRLTLYYDAGERGYHAAVSYPNGESTLTSQLFFSERGVEDGFYTDYTTDLLIQRKSDLIRVFQENEMSVITDEVGLLQTREEPLAGSYGTVNENVIPLMHFSVTFREEKPDREVFAWACGDALLALQEANVTFGQITFYGLDAGNILYRCDLTFDTAPEEILSLVKYNR